MKNRYPEYQESFQQDFWVQHKQSEKAEKSTFHIHQDFELLYLPVGGACLETAQERFYPPPKSLLIFNNMDLHHIYPVSGTRYDRYVAYFKPEYIAPLSTPQTNLLECFYFRPFDHPQLLPLTDAQAESVLMLFERAEAMLQGGDAHRFGIDLLPKLLLAEMLVVVNTAYRVRHGISGGYTHENHERIYDMINYIHRHYADPLSLELLSEKFFINKSYLCTLFQQITGVTPNRYIIHCRMMKAKQLLADGLPVDEVCGRSGFRNLSHFSRSFKQYAGLSPKKYQLSVTGSRMEKP